MSAIIAISCSPRNSVHQDDRDEIAVEEVAMADESLESPQRWTAKRRAALVKGILKGETSAQADAGDEKLSRIHTPAPADRRRLGRPPLK